MDNTKKFVGTGVALVILGLAPAALPTARGSGCRSVAACDDGRNEDEVRLI